METRSAKKLALPDKPVPSATGTIDLGIDLRSVKRVRAAVFDKRWDRFSGWR
jgi:hypothetical protein